MPHVAPFAPQLAVVSVVMHIVPSLLQQPLQPLVELHPHLLFAQLRPAPQALPHVPQLLLFDVRSTQAVPHWVNVPVQPHVPVIVLQEVAGAAHIMHLFPPAPQFVPVSAASSVQAVPAALQHPLQLVVVLHTQAPAEQMAPDPQEWPHAPQLFASVIRFTHVGDAAVPHWVFDPVHPHRPLLLLHESAPAHPMHVCPPAPHIALVSLASASHVVPLQQPAQLALQTHCPALHAVPCAHMFPHAPQLLLSVCSLTQAPPQIVCPAAAQTHAPATQLEPVGHARPQAPQLLALVIRLTSQPFVATPSQSPNPLLHDEIAQLLALHCQLALPPVHTLPHEPQLLTSFASSTQVRVAPHPLSGDLHTQTLA
jgi:hypothetical protein